MFVEQANDKICCSCCLTQQMKNLFCNTLASCLCMKRPTTSPSMDLTLTNRTISDIANHNGDAYPATSSSLETSDSESTNKLLQRMCVQMEEICRVLDARMPREQQRYENSRDIETRNEWMLAAAVLNRICAIIFIVVLVGGTATFFVMFVCHP